MKTRRHEERRGKRRNIDKIRKKKKENERKKKSIKTPEDKGKKRKNE